jgi:hypothetical protein
LIILFCDCVVIVVFIESTAGSPCYRRQRQQEKVSSLCIASCFSLTKCSFVMQRVKKEV